MTSYAVTADYTRFVYRVWDALEKRTGHAPFYLDRTHIAGYCPACGDGTLLIGFAQHPEPQAFISSQAGGAEHCSRGCTEEEIAKGLFG